MENVLQEISVADLHLVCGAGSSFIQDIGGTPIPMPAPIDKPLGFPVTIDYEVTPLG